MGAYLIKEMMWLSKRCDSSCCVSSSGILVNKHRNIWFLYSGDDNDDEDDDDYDDDDDV